MIEIINYIKLLWSKSFRIIIITILLNPCQFSIVRIPYSYIIIKINIKIKLSYIKY